VSGAPVFTGIGAVAPNGLGTDAYWKATLAGHSGLGPISRFDPSGYPVRVAGEIRDFDPAERIPARLLPQTDHSTRLSLYAAELAMRDSGADPKRLPEYAVGIATASSMGGFEFGQRELQNLWGAGATHVSAYQSFAWFYAVNTGQISIRMGLRGPGAAVVTDHAGGLDAVGEARRRLRRGSTLMLCGGVDGSLCPFGIVGHLSSGLISPVADPDRAYLPFSARASGHVPGEGGAILVLEDAESARRRGAAVYGELAGYAAAFEPGPVVSGEAFVGAIGRALDDAAVHPDEVDVVFADAAGVAELDRAEAEAITTVFGPEAVRVTAPKSLVGRLGAGGGGLDLATALLSLRDGVIPHTANVEECAPGYGIALVVGAPVTADLGCALVLARGHGGFHSAVVLRRSGIGNTQKG
jgi:minimal PKS chain-length factor (CLF/KS beta)